jgi:hypothetical protein
MCDSPRWIDRDISDELCLRDVPRVPRRQRPAIGGTAPVTDSRAQYNERHSEYCADTRSGVAARRPRPVIDANSNWAPSMRGANIDLRLD